MMTADELLAMLRKAPEAHASERPWYIGLLLGVAGWFAGLLLLIFVGAVLRPDTGPGALVTGFVLLAAAWGLFKIDREGAFVSQLALALSIAAQFALLFGFHELLFKGHKGGIASIAFVALVIQLALIPAMPNGLHRSMSTIFACIAWAIFVRYGLWDQPFWADWGAKSNRPTVSLGMALLGWVVAWAPAGGALYLLVRKEPAWMAAGRQAVARPGATGLILGLAFATLLSHPFEAFTLFSDQGPRVGWLALWPMLSALASLGALAAAFALGSRGLMGLCVLAALVHASHFYYAIGASLLIKAVLMLVMGVACLALAQQLGARK